MQQCLHHHRRFPVTSEAKFCKSVQLCYYSFAIRVYFDFQIDTYISCLADRTKTSKRLKNNVYEKAAFMAARFFGCKHQYLRRFASRFHNEKFDKERREKCKFQFMQTNLVTNLNVCINKFLLISGVIKIFVILALLCFLLINLHYFIELSYWLLVTASFAIIKSFIMTKYFSLHYFDY